MVAARRAALVQDDPSLGADPSGSTDSSKAIATAIEIAAAKGARAVVVPPGRYRVGALALPDHDLEMRAGGEVTFVAKSTGLTFAAPTTRSLRLHGIAFEGWSQVVNLNGIEDETSVDHVELSDCKCTEGTRLLDWVTSAGTGRVERLVVQRCRGDAVAGSFVNVEGGFDSALVADNEIVSSGGIGFRLGNNSTDQAIRNRAIVRDNVINGISVPSGQSIYGIIVYARDVRVAGNIVTDVTGVDGETAGIYTKSLRNIVANNIVRDISGGTTVRGISIKGDAIGGTPPLGYNSFVLGNLVSNVGDGIRLENEHIVVANNIIEETEFEGITCATSPAAGRLVICGNSLRRSASPRARTGINITGESAKQITVSGNNVRGYEYGVSVVPLADDSVSELLVTGNNFNDVRIGVRMQPVGTIGYAKIANNFIADTGAAAIQTFGAGAITELWIEGNTGANLGGVLFQNALAPTTLNGRLTYSTTWDPGAVNAGEHTSTTFTATGARLGGRCSVGASVDLGDGMVLTALVSAANTIRLILKNETTSPVDLGSITVTVTLVQE